MANAELVMHWVESGSNSMSTYQALLGAKDSSSDSLSILQNGTNLVATVSNVSQMLQPIRIITNGLSATSALTRIVVDWKDPDKKVQPGDVLTLISASGMFVVTLLFWAEVGPGGAAAVGGLALAADLQSSFQPYMNAAKVWLGNYISNLVQVSRPASIASASLYWSAPLPEVSTTYTLLSYDEITAQKARFICLSDKGTPGNSLFPLATPVPGSLTPVNEDMYKDAYCRSLADPTTDPASWLPYCKSVMVR
ncbi:MAG TPA: hypothetical protein VF534_19585 [Paraburkholderia sp.]